MTTQRESVPRSDLPETREPDARAPESKPAAADPFSPENLKLSQSFIETAGVKKLTTTVPVRKPSAQDFVRARHEPQFRENFPIIELKDERDLAGLADSPVHEVVVQHHGAFARCRRALVGRPAHSNQRLALGEGRQDVAEPLPTRYRIELGCSCQPWGGIEVVFRTQRDVRKSASKIPSFVVTRRLSGSIDVMVCFSSRTPGLV